MKYVDELVKAAKGMSGFMKKAAGHHVAKAALHKADVAVHEEIAECHKAMAEAHKSEKADAAGLQKGMHASHASLHKAFGKLASNDAKYADHEEKMADACKAAHESLDGAADETEKAVKAVADGADPEVLVKSVAELSVKLEKAQELLSKSVTPEAVGDLIKAAIDKNNSEALEPMVVKTVGTRMVGRTDVKDPVSTEGVQVHEVGI